MLLSVPVLLQSCRSCCAEEATSELLPAAQEDLARNLEICDLIRSRQVPGRNAMRAFKERLLNRNPNVQLLALSVSRTPHLCDDRL